MKKHQPITILCVSSYEKGFDFMRECKDQGCRVLLLTSKSLENIQWPREAIDEFNEQLSLAHAVSVPFPQSVPLYSGDP